MWYKILYNLTPYFRKTRIKIWGRIVQIFVQHRGFAFFFLKIVFRIQNNFSVLLYHVSTFHWNGKTYIKMVNGWVSLIFWLIFHFKYVQDKIIFDPRRSYRVIYNITISGHSCSTRYDLFSWLLATTPHTGPN